MAYTMGEIVEMRLGDGGVSAVMACPPGLRPSPGQYLLGTSPEAGDLLPTPLFPAELPGDVMAFAAPVPPGWTAGTRLALRGPLGRGFFLPKNVNRVALAALGPSAGVLLPLADMALEAGAEVALYAGSIPAGLPAKVEVLPLDLLAEAPAWAGYLAVDLPVQAVGDLPRLFELRPHQRLVCEAEALVRAPMPCGGTAECGACAVRTRSGWRLACKDGPVFDLGDLL